MILERGALLKNRYRIVEILGQGGMGSVYRAIDENLGMEVAVKDNLFTTEEYARQFRREAQILANLRHPNLPRVTDHFVMDGQGQYLVMDYIEGEDLRQRMDRLGLLTDEEVITIGAAICDALSYLGSRNPPVVHRDIKPGNVKITSNGQIFLVDFGLAKIMDSSQATTTGARAMTPGYSPPEQYGTARTDQRSDVFSLGATLYAALTGAIPEDALARAMGQAELTPVRKRNPRVSRRLANVIERSLSIRPEERYADAEAFKQALLNARSTSRRRVEVFPSPLMPSQAEERSLEEGTALRSLSPAEPLPVAAGWENSDPYVVPSQPVVRSNRRSGCLLGIALAVLALFGGLIAVASNPALLPAPLAAWAGLPATPTQTPAATQGLTPALPLATRTLPAAPTLTPTATVPPTVTPTPTLTPTLIPTPLGGGIGQIAFASDVNGVIQIYRINNDGTGLVQMTDVYGGACQPAWSPDGQQIVFISPCDSNDEEYPNSGLFIMNVDGSGLKPLTNVPGGDFDPAWSPDGQKIAFTSIRDSGRPQIFVYSFQDGSIKLLSEKYSRDVQPAWSPDGRSILYISYRMGPAQVWLMDADGQNPRQFTNNQENVYAHPAYSPNGEFVLFTKLPKVGGIPRMVVVPNNEEEFVEYRITQDPLPMREGRYSPDGLWIAFEGWPAGLNHDIYIIAANGAARRQLTTNPRLDFDPAWRPGS